MKTGRVVLAVSSVLFTFGLVTLAPAMWRDAATLCVSSPWASGPLYRYHDCFAPTGFGSLAVIAIGLIVTWAGYVRGVRWTWFIMFLIVWVWAFPVFVLTFVHPWRSIGLLPSTLARAVREGGPDRIFAEIALSFLLMVLALVLPLKAFIPGLAGGPSGSGHTNLGAPDKRNLAET